MKLAVITSVFPYPLDEGGKTAQFLFLKELCIFHDVTLICILPSSFESSFIDGLCQEIKGLTIHPIFLNEKRPLYKPIWVRVLNKILWIGRKRKWYLESETTLLDNPVFIDPIQPKPEKLVSELREILKSIKPDLVQIDFIDNSDLVFAIPDGIKKVLIIHDLRSLAVAQFSDSQYNSKGYGEYLFQLVFAKETSVIKEFDGILCFNKKDASLLERSGIGKLKVIPFSVDIPKGSSAKQVFPKKKLVLLGPGHHLPNRDALEWFVKDLSPIIRSLVEIETWVIGNWDESTIKIYGSSGKIVFKGFLPSLGDALKDSILLVPLRIGSGLRTKILDAFSLKVPVISTSIGIDGIPAIHGEHCFIADDPESIAAMICSLIQDEKLVERLTANAFSFLEKHFSHTAIYKQRIEFYQSLLLSE